MLCGNNEASQVWDVTWLEPEWLIYLLCFSINPGNDRILTNWKLKVGGAICGDVHIVAPVGNCYVSIVSIKIFPFFHSGS